MHLRVFCVEAGLKGAKYETISEEIILNSEITVLLNKYREGFANDIAKMVAGESPVVDIYDIIVSSQFDADRFGLSTTRSIDDRVTKQHY